MYKEIKYCSVGDDSHNASTFSCCFIQVFIKLNYPVILSLFKGSDDSEDVFFVPLFFLHDDPK